MGKTGLWLVGARGGVSTTVITGLAALSRGLRTHTGLITEHPVFKNCELPELQEFVIGGHEIRTGSLQESARAIEKDSNSIPGDLIRALSEELDKVDTEIKPGILVNAGEAIQSLDQRLPGVEDMDPGAALTKVVSDLTHFRASNQLNGLVVVVLSSTEAPLPHHPSHDSATALLEAAESGVREAFRSSTIYAMASAQVGASFVNFTPSPAALIPATREMLESHQCAYCGCDGKTGETLVKSALAPMFAQRALNVLTWQSYNMLGDRDGEVLSHEDNRSSKITSKGELIHEILGEGVHSQVSIDYVPSLGDNKTAWDLIHFSGFLDHRMTMQFTWQGCDAILAAPLVIDLARLLETSRRRGESGLQSHCGLFFKSPMDSRTHALGDQFDALISKAKSWGSQL